MTKEYALHLLNQLMIGASVDAKPIIPQYELAQAIDLAIKALEQLQDVHDTCKNCIEFSEFKQQPCEDCISRAYLLNHDFIITAQNGISHRVIYATRVEEAPSVTPQRPKGTWIATGVDGEFECSCCQNLWQDAEENTYDDWIHIAKFCPCCGAEMGGVET